MATVRVETQDGHADYPDATYIQEAPAAPPGERQPPMRVLAEDGTRTIAGYAAGSYQSVGFVPEPEKPKRQRAAQPAEVVPEPVTAMTVME